MGAFLVVALLFWLLPILAGQMIGGRKNRAGWAYGLLLGWLGVIIVALRDAKIDTVTVPAGAGTAVAVAAVAMHRPAAGEPATIALPASVASAPSPPPPSLPPAGWYNDPQTSGGGLRWWDGSAWTDFTAPGAAPSSGVLAPG